MYSVIKMDGIDQACVYGPIFGACNARKATSRKNTNGGRRDATHTTSLREKRLRVCLCASHYEWKSQVMPVRADFVLHAHGFVYWARVARILWRLLTCALSGGVWIEGI
jgi:hypothetical protein